MLRPLLIGITVVGITFVFGCSSGPCDDTDELCVLSEETSEAYLCVRAHSDEDVWLVGTEGVPDVSGPSALRWDGAVWTRLDLSDYPGRELWWAHPGEGRVTMVGSAGLLLEYERSSGLISSVEGPDAAVTFFGVWGSNDDDVWAVGGDVGGTLPGQIWRRDAAGWAPYTGLVDAPEGTLWFKVDGRASDDVWIVGSGGRSLHWNGSELVAQSTAEAAAGASLFTVDATGDEVLAVGGAAEGVILHYSLDDDLWVDRAPDFSGGINGVCSSGGRTRAVGGQGTVYTLDDGVWTYELGGLTLRDYHACAVSPSGDLWAVGGQIVSRPLNAGVVSYAGPRSVPSLPGW